MYSIDSTMTGKENIADKMDNFSLKNERLNINFCRCCLSDFIGSDNDEPPLNMQNETFVYGNERISFVDGYFDVNNYCVEDFPNVPTSEVKICSLCVVQLESAYVFKRLCQEANSILRRKYSLSEVAASSETDHPIKEELQEVVIKDEIDTSCSETRTENDEDTNLNSESPSCTSLREPVTYKTINNELPSTDSNTQQHSNLEEDVVQPSKICSKVYGSFSALGAHNRKKHLKKRYICKICEKAFAFHYTLKEHTQVNHTNIQHQCGQCLKFFKSVATLKSHTKFHHTLGQFTCDICSTVFISRRTIFNHMKIIHLKHRYTCKICKKQFTNKNSIWGHSFEHRGFMPFERTNCDFKSNWRQSFQKHLDVSHSIKYDTETHAYKNETFKEVLDFVL